MDHRIDGTNLVSKRNAKQLFRKHIFDIWHNTCAYCGSIADTLDHVKPRHKGGNTIAPNLVPACRTCNRLKGSNDWLTWFAAQPTYTSARAYRISTWLSN